MAWAEKESLFLNNWEKQNFIEWNEMDVREEFIAPLLDILGYSKRTINNIIREKSLTLLTPYHRVGRKRVSIDYLPTIRLKQFWIIEAKPGKTINMDYGDLLQAHLYAIHPEIQAKFIVLINGWEIRIYDSLKLESWDDALLVCNKENCKENFLVLKQMLSAESMLQYQRSRIIDIARETFLVEFDETQVREFEKEIKKLIREITPIVNNNAREIQRNAWKEQQSKEKEELEGKDIKALLIGMDLPTNRRNITAREYIRRIEKADMKEKAELIDQLVMFCRGRPHAIFRVFSVYILLNFLKKGIEITGLKYTESLEEAFKEVVVNNLNYWSINELSFALCHLDNISLRLAKKMCLKVALKEVDKFVQRRKEMLSLEDLLKEEPTAAKEMVSMIGRVGERLWRQYSTSSQAEDIWKGIREYEVLEAQIDELPQTKYSDGDEDLLFFESYGKSFDMLFMGTWSMIHNDIELLRELKMPEEVLTIASLKREEALKAIPKLDNN